MSIKIQWLIVTLWILLTGIMLNKYMHGYREYRRLEARYASTPNISAADLQALIAQQNSQTSPEQLLQEDNPYTFGIYLRQMILDNKLQLQSYRIKQESGSLLLEFQASGGFDAIMQLLYAMHQANINLYLFDLSILQKGKAYVSFQIPYTMD